MDELERRIARWHEGRYGVNIDIQRTLVKLLEEAGELAKAVLKGDPVNAVEEVADVAVVLCHVCRHFGTDLTSAVAAKLPVIEERLKKRQEGRRP